MTWEIGLVFAIIVVIIVLFAFEVFAIDTISFCLIGILILTGLVSPKEGIQGFSNAAVITILCLMIIATALEQNGVIGWMALGLKKFRGLGLILMIPLFMIITGSISAFISSTAVVIVFIKIITELSDRYNISKSKLLLPISYASILGGSCTLMGTSTNLIVNDIYATQTGERLQFFEFTWLGVCFLLVAIVVIALLYRLLPEDNKEKLVKQYGLDDYIVTIKLTENSKLIGKRLEDTFLAEENDITVLRLVRKNGDDALMQKSVVLKEGDRIMMSCTLENLLSLKSNHEIIINPEEESDGIMTVQEFKEARGKEGPNKVLLELLMLPGARFLGKTLKEIRKNLPDYIVPLAIRKRKNLRHLKDRIIRFTPKIVKLKVGDRILIEMEKNKISDFDFQDNIAILQEYEAPEVAASKKRNLSLFILVMVVLMAATGIFAILTSTILGCVALLLTGCITLENVYKKIDWQIIFLLAGMIPLGVAMHNTGADLWLTEALINWIHGKNSTISIGILFLITMLLSSVVSNNATAIIMAPIAISLANGMQMETKPFILAVMFAANFSFFTPMGYQTNALVYSMGIYKFKHFLIFGGVLSFILWILATFLLGTTF